jgi:hypothetical protein
VPLLNQPVALQLALRLLSHTRKNLNDHQDLSRLSREFHVDYVLSPHTTLHAQGGVGRVHIGSGLYSPADGLLWGRTPRDSPSSPTSPAPALGPTWASEESPTGSASATGGCPTRCSSLEARCWHRWVVSGHWRNQSHGPGREQRRRQWIPAHIKGPDGAPLLATERVNGLAAVTGRWPARSFVGEVRARPPHEVPGPRRRRPSWPAQRAAYAQMLCTTAQSGTVAKP